MHTHIYIRHTEEWEKVWQVWQVWLNRYYILIISLKNTTIPPLKRYGKSSRYG